jgi:hypothetical protein
MDIVPVQSVPCLSWARDGPFVFCPRDDGGESSIVRGADGGAIVGPGVFRTIDSWTVVDVAIRASSSDPRSTVVLAPLVGLGCAPGLVPGELLV